MSTDLQAAPRPLPDRPNLRHLKDQAKDLVKAGAAKSITDAQFQIARLYGFPSWPKLKAYVDSLDEIGQLEQAIDTNDLARVKNLMIRNPELHRAPLGYSKNGPLTWVAECRVPWEPPSPARLAMAKWMIANGSDVHQGGDGPLMRAALKGNRIPMMELLVSYEVSPYLVRLAHRRILGSAAAYTIALLLSLILPLAALLLFLVVPLFNIFPFSLDRQFRASSAVGRSR